MVESIRRQIDERRLERVAPSVAGLLVSSGETLFAALERLHARPEKAVIIVDAAGRLAGILDEAGLRGALLTAGRLDATLRTLDLPQDPAVHVDTPFDEVVRITLAACAALVPVLDDRDRVINAFTREQLHHLLAGDLPWDPRCDFTILAAGASLAAGDRPDAVTRPWGFYRSLLTTAFTQAKILSVAPGQELSLQKHFRREEYWTVVRGQGIFRLDDDRYTVRRGFTVHIPREAVHWIRNTHSSEALILIEVQVGDYFGEDDIFRLSDRYHRA